MFTLPHWLFPGDDRPTAEIDDEIEEELRLHLDLLALERAREGLSNSEAQQAAAERFGDLDSIKRRCRAEMQGDIPMLKRLQTGLLAVLTMLVVMLGVRDYVSAMAITNHMTQSTQFLVEIQSDLAELRGEIELTKLGYTTRTSALETVARKSSQRADLTGAVTDANSKPLADADVLLIVKTWPNNRFRQDDYAVKTDEKGRFVLKGRIPLSGQYGVNAAVVAEEYAIASQYVLVEDPAGEPPEELAFELPKSTETRILVTDEAGKPLARALVAPSERIDAEDKEHLVYHQGSNPVWKKTDAEGAVTIDWFAPATWARSTSARAAGSGRKKSSR